MAGHRKQNTDAPQQGPKSRWLAGHACQLPHTLRAKSWAVSTRSPVQDDQRHLAENETKLSGGHKQAVQSLPRDQEAILAVDERAGTLHGHLADFVQHPLCSNFGFHCPFHVPNVAVFGSHLGAVEARMEQHHGYPGGPQLLGHQHPGDVAGRAAHVVPVIPTLPRILSFTPLDGASLTGDDDDFPRFEEPRVVQFCRHTQGPKRTNVNLLEFLLAVQGCQGLFGLHEIPCVVDENVEWLRYGPCHLGHRCRVRHIHSCDDAGACGLHCRRASAASDNDFRALPRELLR
mmetsp:Transcript_40258/g.93637  ORF Transcript_40258/g.93637 Transcript_40258/m.93637 type:complete len:289 (+) Transcript_40258:91-957(+)